MTSSLLLTFSPRIPLHLFPIETQNKILEVEQEVEEEEKEKEAVSTEAPEKYIDSSSFRQPVVDNRSAVDLSLR